MSTPPLSRLQWQVLYERAILELDYTKVQERIEEARHAMNDRAEEILTDSSSSERQSLRSAFRTLDVLREVTEREKCA